MGKGKGKRNKKRSKRRKKGMRHKNIYNIYINVNVSKSLILDWDNSIADLINISADLSNFFDDDPLVNESFNDLVIDNVYKGIKRVIGEIFKPFKRVISNKQFRTFYPDFHLMLVKYITLIENDIYSDLSVFKMVHNISDADQVIISEIGDKLAYYILPLHNFIAIYLLDDNTNSVVRSDKALEKIPKYDIDNFSDNYLRGVIEKWI